MAIGGIKTSIDVRGLTQTIAAVAGLTGPALKKKANASLKRSVPKILVPAIQAATPHPGAGHGPSWRGTDATKGLLNKRSAITARNVPLRSGEIAAISVKPRSSLGAWWEHMVVQGTKAHVISPAGYGRAVGSLARSINRNATAVPALYINGTFTPFVNHPGAKPTDYIHKAAQGKDKLIADQLAADLAKEFGKP
jgi:hypothetical protein